MNPLPVFRTALLTAAAIRYNWSSLLVALVIPALCISIVEVLVGGLPTGALFTLLGAALSVPFYAVFAIVCHRIVILGSDSLVNRYGVFWGEREFRFLGWTVVLFLLSLFFFFFIGFAATVFAQVIPPGVFPILFLAVVWVGFTYIYTRLSVLFPAIAVDEDTGFERAWELSEGNGFRMLAVALLTAGPFTALLYGVAYFAPAGLLKLFTTELLGHVLMLVSVCAVSVTYRELVRIELEQFGESPRKSPDDSAGGPPRNPFDS